MLEPPFMVRHMQHRCHFLPACSLRRCLGLVDIPDNAAAAALALTINASGNVVLKTAVLMTPEEVDLAVKKSPSYRAPGK